MSEVRDLIRTLVKEMLIWHDRVLNKSLGH